MRNYLADMQRLLDTQAADPSAAPLTAAQLVARLRMEDPDLLTGWLHVRATCILAQHLAHRSTP